MNQPETKYQLKQIKSVHDNRFWKLLDMLAECFPPIEQILPSEVYGLLKSPSGTDGIMTALLTYCENSRSESVVGICMLEYHPRIGAVYIVYLAVRHDMRSRGIGRQLYQAVTEHVARHYPEACSVVLEVEKPELASSEKDRRNRERRIRFYRQQGFRFAIDLNYLQRSSWQTDAARDAGESTELPMILGVHCLKQMHDTELAQILISVFRKGLRADTTNADIVLT